MTSTSFDHPEAYRNVALAAFEHAFGLCVAAHAAAMSARHDGGEGLSDEQRRQREAIVGIQVKLLEAARDEAMDKAMADWSLYRRMTS